MTEFLEQLKDLIKAFEKKQNIRISTIFLNRRYEVHGLVDKPIGGKLDITLEMY